MVVKTTEERLQNKIIGLAAEHYGAFHLARRSGLGR